jgi:hypothetical protein
VHSRNGAIGATLAFPPSLGGPFAIFGPNFQFSTVNPFDVIPAEFKWNPVAGGFEFNVQILGRDLTRPVDIAVYWARGSTRNDTIGTPIYEVTIPASPVGIYGPFTFGGQTLANAPAGVSHLILVVDPQDQTGDDKSNNVLALLDVQLSYKSGVPEVLSDYTEGVLKGVLRQAGQSTVLITSTFRTPREQAEAMYVNLVNDDKIHYQCKWAQLASNEFRKLRNKGASEPVIVTGMTQFIEIDPCCVSHHCCDFSRRQVIDISRQSISGKLFEAVARNESRIDQKESFPKKDPAFHIEIEQ